jgi:hypothetical protein
MGTGWQTLSHSTVPGSIYVQCCMRKADEEEGEEDEKNGKEMIGK